MPCLSTILGCITELLTALELGSLWYHVIVITSFWSLDEHTARNQTATPSVSTQSHPFETALNFHSAVISYSKNIPGSPPKRRNDQHISEDPQLHQRAGCVFFSQRRVHVGRSRCSVALRRDVPGDMMGSLRMGHVMYYHPRAGS